MQTPTDIEACLRGIIAEAAEADRVELSPDDLEYIQGIIKSLKGESQGIFVAIHPGNKMQYILINADRVGGLKLLNKVMHRILELEEAEHD